MHCHGESLRVHHGALRLAQHLLALNHDFFDGSIVELVELARERFDNVIFAILSVNLGKLGLVCCISRLLFNEWIRAAEEVLEDLVVVA